VKCGARIAMGVAGGYFLGRTKKMKLALMLGGWAAGRQLGGPGQILGQATKVLGDSPELTALTDQVRGRLLEAGKDAAMAVATRRVEALTDRVGRRVEELADVRRMADPDIRRVADIGGLDTASRNGEEDEDYGTDEEDEEEAFDEEPQPVRRTRARTSNSQSGRTADPSRSAAGSRSSANARAVGGRRSSDQRSSSSGTAKKATSRTSPRKSTARTQTAKKGGVTSSSRTPKRKAVAKKASRTARTQREDRNG
jgi:hypothetical protein